MEKKGKLALAFAGAISASTAIAHLSCIILGPSCYQAQLAPEKLVQLSCEGSLLAPIATILVSSLFFICAFFAFSAAGFFSKFPFIKPALVAIACICMLRGVATIPLSLVYPEMVSTTSILAGMIWFVTGTLYFYGYLCFRKAKG